MLNDIAGKLKAALVSATVVMACAGQAHAASFVGEWDPAFGPDFPNLGWRGKAVFVIPDACLAADGIYTNLSACANGGLQITSAKVDFYNLGSPPAIGSPIQPDLEFFQPSGTLTMEVRNGELYGVIGGFGDAVTSSFPDVISEGYQDTAPASFRLFFRDVPLGSSLSNGAGFADYYAQMSWTQKRDAGDSCINVWGVVLDCSYGFSSLDLQNGGSTFLKFTRLGLEVPEPGSLALLLPAVGMLAAFRRRKHAPAA
jgi:hypothetical protein